MHRIAITPGDGRELGPALDRLVGRVDAVILREPRLGAAELAELAARAQALGIHPWLHARNPHAAQIAADRGLGLHLPAGHPAVGLRHGRSCHDGPALDRAFAQGAAYALLSPVFAPGSKPDDRRPTLGIEGYLRLAAGRPVAALGGVDPARARALASAGAWGIAQLGACFPS